MRRLFRGPITPAATPSLEKENPSDTTPRINNTKQSTDRKNKKRISRLKKNKAAPDMKGGYLANQQIRGLPKQPKPGTYREPGSVKFSKTRNRNLPGHPKTLQTSNRNLTRNRTKKLRPFNLVHPGTSWLSQECLVKTRK